MVFQEQMDIQELIVLLHLFQHVELNMVVSQEEIVQLESQEHHLLQVLQLWCKKMIMLN